MKIKMETSELAKFIYEQSEIALLAVGIRTHGTDPAPFEDLPKPNKAVYEMVADAILNHSFDVEEG